MSSVLDRLRDARPVVAPPSDGSRREARERLLAAIEDEPPGLHSRRARREAAADQISHEAHHGSRRHPMASTRARRLRSSGRRARGTFVSLAVTAVAAGVVAIVLLVPGHRRDLVTGDHPGGQGGIEARDGESLAGPHPLLPAVIAAGLRKRYRTELSDGRTLRTTIDLALQRVGMHALRHSVASNHGDGGAFVALDSRTGAVEALGVAGARGRTAQVDTAIAAAAPPGGTFAPITALAALQAGVWSPTEVYNDTGTLCVVSTRTCLHNTGDVANGPITLARALAVQDELFTYQLGNRLNSNASAGGPLQQTARRLGLGQPTGIDLPEEAAGAVPSPGTERPRRWSVNDTVDLAAGQGSLAVTPVQLAVAYAAIANGGTVVRPHLVAGPTAGSGIGPGTHHLALSSGALDAVRRGLAANAATAGGVTSAVMRSLRVPVAGAVGTAQLIDRHDREIDDGWYAGYIRSHGRSLVAVILVEGDGFGDAVAAPVARQLFSEWIAGRPGPWVPGYSVARWARAAGARGGRRAVALWGASARGGHERARRASRVALWGVSALGCRCGTTCVV